MIPSLLKSVVHLLFPVSLCMTILAIGTILLWTKKIKVGKIAVTTGLFLLVLFSNGYLSNTFLGVLEYHHPSLLEVKTLTQNSQDIRYIVVLGGGPLLSNQIPVTSRMNRAALMRLIEGIRLQKAIPRTKLVLSGGGKSAETMNAMALSLKIPEENIILETQSSNTYDEVLLLKDMLSEQLFILVTSASHMPRSMALFKHAGLNPIPAPTDHRTSSSYQFKLNELIPSLHSLENFHGAFYEYLAITKEYLLRRI